MKTHSPNVSGRHIALVALVAAMTWLWASAGSLARGQSVTATLVGTVLDQSGAAVPDANLSLTRVGTNITRAVVSNERGDFTIPNVAPGSYRLVGEHEGFKRTVMDDVELLVNQTARVDLVLQVGAVTESVAVTGTVPLVASETSSVGQVITTSQIENLPLRGRAVFDLAVLSPATSPRSPDSYAGGQRPMPGGLGSPVFSAGGGRDNANGYLVDGVEAIDPHYMTPSMFPPMDSMQEFKIQTNSYSAEFGRFAVQVNATTKSGTNQLHGSLHHFFRNNVLDAANFFNNFFGLERAPLRYNLFGGTLGGPIVRDRTFFFVSYEGTRIRRGKTSQANVPTEEQWNGDFSRLGFRNNRPIFDPATTRANPSGSGVIRDPFPGNIIPANRITLFGKGVAGIYPAAGLDVPTGNNFFAALSDQSDNNQIITRVDHQLTDKTSISVRYNIFGGVDTDKAAIYGTGRSTDVRTQNAALSIPHTFSPTTLYELRLGYNRPNYFLLQDGANETDYREVLGIRNLLADPVAWGVPSLGIVGFTGIGWGTEPNGQITNSYQLINQLTLIRGSHTLKFGGEGRKTNYNDRGEISARGSYSFTGVLTANPQARASTGVSVADLLLGLPLTASGTATSLAGSFNQYHFFGFVQDDWKISPRVTLNLGLRYELNLRYVEAQNRQSFFDRGFPGGRLLLAGSSQAFIPPEQLVDGPATPRGLYPADTNNWGPRIGIAFRPFGDNRTAIRVGYGIFYSMMDGQSIRQLERNPPHGRIASVQADQDANSSGPSAIRTAELFPAQGTLATRPNIYTDIGPRPEPYIQQWNLNIQRQLFSETLLEVGYLGSKGTRMVYYGQGNQASHADPGNPTPILSRRPFPLWGNTIRTSLADGISSYHGGFVKLERRFSSGLSFLTHYTFAKSLDISSQVNEEIRDFYNPRLSKGRSLSDIRHRAVFSATYVLPLGTGKRYLSKGVASHVLGNWQTNTIVNLQSGFGYDVSVGGDPCNCAASSQTADQVGDPHTGFTRSREMWFNTAAFARPPAGRFGTSGRNILDGPGQATVDFSLFKIVQVKEGMRVQIRGEFFNLFNRVNFGVPGSNVATPATYGIIQSARDARIVQVAIRLVF
ncbi:MAG: TonB-dependent receptor [Bryobacteraceae bacterium]